MMSSLRVFPRQLRLEQQVDPSMESRHFIIIIIIIIITIIIIISYFIVYFYKQEFIPQLN